MKITVGAAEITLSEEYTEYLDLMCAAVVKPGEPPVESRAKMIEKILLDNYGSNIQQHAAVRPAKLAAHFKELETSAAAAIQNAIATAIIP